MTSVSPGPSLEPPSWRRITPGQKSMAHSPFSAGREARSVGSQRWGALLCSPSPHLTAGGLQLQARRGCKPSGQGWVGQVVWIARAGQKGAFPERLGNYHKRESWTSPTIKNDFRKGSS